MSRTRVGVVGLGIGRLHAAGWASRGAELHVYDLLADRRSRAVSELGAVEHTDLESLVDAVDVVDVCTPTPTHVDIALAAVEAGRGLVVEKPVARNLDDAERLRAACRAHGTRSYAAQVVRFFPEYAAAQEAVTKGRVGRPAVLRLTREGGLPRHNDWMQDPEQSGGVVCDVMIHDIDYARWIAGDVVRVYATTMRPEGPHGVHTHAYAVLTHVGGAISHVTASWARNGAPFRTSFEIAGDAGMLQYATDEHTPLHVAPAEVTSTGLPPITGEDPFTLEVGEFLRAFEGGPPSRVDLGDGQAALAIALAVRESAAAGRAVELPAADVPYTGSAPRDSAALKGRVA